MAITPAADNRFSEIASLLVGTNQSRVSGAPAPLPQLKTPIAPIEGSFQEDKGFSLGQGLIDTLSAGTYSIAGVGQKIGENVQAIQQGDAGGALDLFNPFSSLLAAGGGIQNRRTWSDNLKDWGVAEEDAFWPGLAMDVVLDPLWLIPGGAIAAGIKGTTKGVGLASAATKGGVKLTEPALKAASKEGQIVYSKTGVELPADTFPTGQGSSFFNNLIQGVRQGNVDEYAKWGTARQAKKDAKLAKKDLKTTQPNAVPLIDNSINLISDVIKDVKHVADEGQSAPAEKAAQTIEDAIETAATPKKAELDSVKSADPITERTLEKAPTSTFKQARDTVGEWRDNYLKTRNIEAPKVDYKNIDVSPLANDIAQAYNKLISNPTNPEVIAAYTKLSDEVADQYKYLTEDLGIKVEYINDGDAYMKLNAKGESVPDPVAMMRDIIENKTLKVRGSAQDFALDPHPILSVQANDMFRAVHDFFGHAGSGRGFMADGEEAAWVAHSQMFSPLARRAMTTETRGQNSYYNFFDPERKQFAPQKAALLPDEFVALPTETAALESRVGKTNTFIGLAANALNDFKDELIDKLGLISSPIRGAKQYSKEELAQISSTLDRITAKEYFAPSTEVGQGVAKLLTVLDDLVKAPTAEKYATLYAGENSITGLLELAEAAFKVKDPTKQKAYEQSLAAFRQLLDRPVDATDLLESALAAEGRVVSQPAPFRPTVWAAPAKANELIKPIFSVDKLRKFFPDDELLRDQEALDLAFGATKVRPGTKRAEDLAKKQARIWDHFRARNADTLEDVAAMERTDWFAKNSIDNSELYVQIGDGSMIGQGMLPASIPYGVLTVQNGHPTTTLGAVLENLGKVINRTGPQMGGLPTTQISGRVGLPTESLAEVRKVRTSDGIPENLLVPKGEALEDITGAGRRARVVQDGAIVSPSKAERTRALEARKRGIELDTYPAEVQSWLMAKVAGLTKEVKTKGAFDARGMDMATDVDAIATRLWDEVPAIKSRSDARLLATLGPKAVTELSKKPAVRYFLDSPISRETGRPDTAVGVATTMKGTRNEQGQVLRDPATGVPVDAKGRPVPENQGLEGKEFGPDGEIIQGAKQPQYRVLTDEGSKFTGRAGGKYASQTGKGPQQLAGLQMARATIGSISEGITAGALKSSPEQAKLLTDVMSSLGIRVAENATPAKVFKQFQEQAAMKFEETVQMIESAAKTESVVYQLRTIFPAAIADNISMMKAIERIDANDLQLKTVNWTEDAMARVDASCRMMTQGNADYGTSIANRVIGGAS